MGPGHRPGGADRLGEEEDKRRTFEAGFDHRLKRPVDPAQLEKLLAGVQVNTT